MNEERKVEQLKVSDILPNRFQPRIKFNESSINELSDSIKEHGVIQPIVVRTIGDKYEIIAGERRYKASVLAGKETIPAIVTSLNDKDSAEVALIENVQRQDLTPIEEAISYKKILDMGYLTQEQLAQKLGKNQSTIANKIRLLNLDEDVQEALLEERISERHARSLLKISDTDMQVKMLNKIISERLTVRKTDEEINKLLNGETVDFVEELKVLKEETPVSEIKPIELLDYANNISNNEKENNMGNDINNMPINPIIEEPIEEIKEENNTENSFNDLIGQTINENLNTENNFNDIINQNRNETNNIDNNFNDVSSNTFAPDFLDTLPVMDNFENNNVNVNPIVEEVALPEMGNIEPLNIEIPSELTEMVNNNDSSFNYENNISEIELPTTSPIIEENIEFNEPTMDINPGFVDVEKIEKEAEDIYKEKPLADLDSLLKSDIIPGLNELQKPEIEKEEVKPVVEEPKFKFFNFEPEETVQTEEKQEETTNPFEFNLPSENINNETPVNDIPETSSEDSVVDINELYGITPDTLPMEEEKEEEIKEEEVFVPQEETPLFVENIEETEPNMNFGDNIFNSNPTDNINLDFNKFYNEEQPVENNVEEVEETPITQPMENSFSEPIVPPSVSFEENVVMPELAEEPVLSVPNEPLNEEKGSIREIINIIRECSDKIEALGYYIDTEEFDFEDMYQVIFKINKN